MIDAVGFLSVCLMVVCYSFEHKSHGFTLAFSMSCLVAAIYAFVIESYPFVLAEGIWAIIAFKKWQGRLV